MFLLCEKNKIVKNGIIIFDDYGIHGVEKVTEFVNRIIKKERRNFIFIQIILVSAYY